MLGHLQEAKAKAMKGGQSSAEASRTALKGFGSHQEIRRRIIRETYGISPNWFISAAALCFIVFIIFLFAQLRVYDVIPATMKPLPAPRWVVTLDSNAIFAHTDLWIGLAVVFVMMIFTRKRDDRIAVMASLAPLCIMWFIIRTVHAFSIGSAVGAMSFSSWPVMQPLGIATVIGYLLLFAECFGLYCWIRNRAVSLTPWVLSIVFTLWPILRDTVQATLWHLTRNPVFWGRMFPDLYFLWWSILTIIVRLIVLGLLMYSWKKIGTKRFDGQKVAP